MILRDARPEEIDRILAHTHALWGDGLEPAAYREYIATLMGSAWAKDEGNYRFLALLDPSGAELLAGLKLYRFAARLDEEPISVGGVGAVFTLPAQRGRGHAASMIRSAHEIMADRGDALSLLFSEIGALYYARLGYQELKSGAVRIRVAAGAAGGHRHPDLRRMSPRELDAVIRIREKQDAGSSFALVRDQAYWSYLLARASFPTLHLGPRIWESRLMMLGREGYLWSQFGAAHGGTSARLLEFGETEPATALPPLLDEFFEQCRARGAAEVEAWLPHDAASRDPRLGPPHVAREDPPSAVPMWYPLDAETRSDLNRHGSAATLHLTDLF